MTKFVIQSVKFAVQTIFIYLQTPASAIFYITFIINNPKKEQQYGAKTINRETGS
jgi:hypothetical protein